MSMLRHVRLADTRPEAVDIALGLLQLQRIGERLDLDRLHALLSLAKGLLDAQHEEAAGG